MKINEVMKITGLTKKAIYYYEEENLITPAKDEENDYRIYSEKEIETLKKICALRKLDVPIKDIRSIINEPKEINDVMIRQLNLIKEKIENLNKSKIIIETLVSEYNSGILAIDTDRLDKLNIYLDLDRKSCAGYMKKELERIFPGNFGKAMAILYSDYLNEPIDTAEKEEAWRGLVNVLDSMQEINYPEDIRIILDNIYSDRSKLVNLQNLTEDVLNKAIDNINKMNDDEKKTFVKKAKTEMGQRVDAYSYEAMMKIDKFMKEEKAHLPVECSKYLKVLSKKYRDFSNYMMNMSKILKDTVGEELFIKN